MPRRRSACSVALTLDPAVVEAQSRLAIHLAGRVLGDMTDTAAADMVRTEGLAAQAVAVAPRSPLAHMAEAQVLRTQHWLDEAVREYETVITLNRNFVSAYYQIGLCKLISGTRATLPVSYSLLFSGSQASSNPATYSDSTAVEVTTTQTSNTQISTKTTSTAANGNDINAGLSLLTALNITYDSGENGSQQTSYESLLSSRLRKKSRFRKNGHETGSIPKLGSH
jgi:hypothetical protein